MEYFVAKEFVGRVGFSVAVNLATALTSSAKSISSLLGIINNDKTQTDLIRLLEETDVETTISVLDTMVGEIRIDEKTPNTIIMCLKKVHSILQKIEAELKGIHDKVKWNKSLYLLKSLRSYTFKSNIARINTLLGVLEGRRKLLFDALNIQPHLVKGEINKRLLEESFMPSKGKPFPKKMSNLALEDSRVEITDIKEVPSKDKTKKPRNLLKGRRTSVKSKKRVTVPDDSDDEDELGTTDRMTQSTLW